MPGHILCASFFFAKQQFVCCASFVNAGSLPKEGADYLAPSRALRYAASPGVSRCGMVGWGKGQGKVVSAIKVVALDCSFIDFFTRVDFYGFLLPG